MYEILLGLLSRLLLEKGVKYCLLDMNPDIHTSHNGAKIFMKLYHKNYTFTKHFFCKGQK